MSNDFSNLRDYKESLTQTSEKVIDLKKSTSIKTNTRICFVITKNKNNSWIDDLHAQAELNQVKRVYN